MSQHSIWDSSRHPAPPPAADGQAATNAPEPVTRLTEVLTLPALPRESCRGVYTSLAEFVAADEFNLTEATRWTRDRMVENGLRVNRHGGRHRRPWCGLRQVPALSHADEIAAAFVSNVLSRAVAADIDLSEEEIQTVHTWFGAP
jgi:hypothetical protein